MTDAQTTGGGNKAVLSVNPTSLDVAGDVGTNPAAQSVQVKNTGKGALKWTVTTPSASWLSVTPTSGTNAGTLTVACASTTLAAGDHAATFAVKAPDNPDVTVSVRLVLAEGEGPIEPPIEPPTSERGPQPSIVPPAGAIAIAPGASIQAAVNGQPEGATFALKAGVHPVTASITPKSGQTFVGDYGAILDGTGWTTSDNTQAAFRAHNQDINHVTIRNLVIRNMPQFAIRGSSPFPQPIAYHPGGADGWLVEHTELHHNLWGVLVGNNSTVRNNSIHHNIGDTDASDANLWGAGLHAVLSENLTIENNEFAYNGANTRLFYTRNCVFRNNYIHHHAWDGIWFDGENTQTQITDNVIEDSVGQGIIYEVSGSAVIRGNIIRRSGDSGIMLASSHDIEVVHNTLEDNWRGINVTVELTHIAEGGSGLEPLWAGNLNIHDNTMRVPTRSGSYASLLTVYNGDHTPYTDGSKKITFTRTTYTAPDLAGPYWLWGPSGNLTWAQWQAIPQDAGGSVSGV